MNNLIHKPLIFKWAHLGMIQGPPDYEWLMDNVIN